MKTDKPLILSPNEVLEVIKNYVEKKTGQSVESVVIKGNHCEVSFKSNTATVWHVRKNFIMGQDLRFPLDYNPVAKVKSSDPSTIYKLTRGNTWYDSFPSGPANLIECLHPSPPGPPLRSTTVGDVIVMDDNKTLYLCTAAGFRRFFGVPQVFTTGLGGFTSTEDYWPTYDDYDDYEQRRWNDDYEQQRRNRWEDDE